MSLRSSASSAPLRWKELSQPGKSALPLAPLLGPPAAPRVCPVARPATRLTPSFSPCILYSSGVFCATLHRLPGSSARSGGGDDNNQIGGVDADHFCPRLVQCRPG